MLKDRLHSDSGFTILELIITITFIGVAFLAIMNAFMDISALNRQSKNLVTASHIAQQKIENYRQTAYADIPTGTPAETFTSELPASLADPKAGTISIVETEPGLKRIDIYINYKEGSVNRRVEISTLVSEQGINR